MGEEGYDLSRFRTTYFEECAELLANAEETFTRLQDGVGNDDDLHAAFRCIHSIKGGAGAFAFDDLVRFAHVFETSLDALRSGRAELSSHVAEVMVRGNDVLGDFVRAAQDGTSLPADHGRAVMAELAAIVGQPAAPAPVAAATPAPVPEPAAESKASTTWRIRLAPTQQMLRTGNDPLLMIRELASLGTLDIACDRNRLPTLAELDPAGTYLAWTFTLVSDQPRTVIEEVFEFVAGDTADVTIDALSSQPAPEEGDGWGIFAPLAAPAAPVAGGAPP
ncbi:MAG: Hpt domain-containing protein, partial [Magnetospirillum sp.]|nr:Hpt domain-containing protein [Magnetospirillum sp.]